MTCRFEPATECSGAFFCLVKRKPPGPRKKYRFFASGNSPTPGCLQMPPMLLRGRPRTYVGYGRHTRPGARPFRYAAAVVGLVTGRRLALSGKVKSRIISGHSPPKSRYVTIRAGQKHTKSYEPRKCAEDNAAVKAASDRLRSVSCLRQRKALFFRGPGGFLCASSKESLPGYRLPIAIGKLPGRPRPLIAKAKSRIVCGHSPPKSRIISGDTPP